MSILYTYTYTPIHRHNEVATSYVHRLPINYYIMSPHACFFFFFRSVYLSRNTMPSLPSSVPSVVLKFINCCRNYSRLVIDIIFTNDEIVSEEDTGCCFLLKVHVASYCFTWKGEKCDMFTKQWYPNARGDGEMAMKCFSLGFDLENYLGLLKRLW